MEESRSMEAGAAVPPRRGGAGLLRSLREAVASLLEHGRLRFEVLQVEGREAALHLLLLAGLLGGAALLGVFACLLVLLALVFLVADATGWSWMWVALAAGGAHVLAAGGLLLVVRTLSRRKMLAASIEEFKRDAQWLRKNTAGKK